MRATIRFSASIATAALLAALTGCADHETRDVAVAPPPPAASESTTTTTGDGSTTTTTTTVQNTGTGAVVDDTTLSSNVKAAIASAPGVDASGISVTTNDGVVTLSGDVDSPSAANAAVEAAQSVNGVKSVENDLTIKH